VEENLSEDPLPKQLVLINAANPFLMHFQDVFSAFRLAVDNAVHQSVKG